MLAAYLLWEGRGVKEDREEALGRVERAVARQPGDEELRALLRSMRAEAPDWPIEVQVLKKRRPGR
jgi:hypothetical protein